MFNTICKNGLETELAGLVRSFQIEMRLFHVSKLHLRPNARRVRLMELCCKILRIVSYLFKRLRSPSTFYTYMGESLQRPNIIPLSTLLHPTSLLSAVRTSALPNIRSSLNITRMLTYFYLQTIQIHLGPFSITKAETWSKSRTVFLTVWHEINNDV